MKNKDMVKRNNVGLDYEFEFEYSFLVNSILISLVNYRVKIPLKLEL